MTNFFIKIIKYLIRKVKRFYEYSKYYTLYPIAKIIYKNRTIYLISERGNDARDNGYYMFRYIRETYPELEVYYVINKESVDYKKIKEIGNAVETKSIKHYLLFIGSQYKISTHIMGYAPDMLFYVSFNIKHRIPGKQIFLQHGIIKNDHTALYAENTKVDMFVCGAKPEYEYVNSQFHYKRNEVKYTGLARFDGLQKKCIKRQILIMPTWRVWLNNLTQKEFVESEYFKQWSRVLNDEKLCAKLREENFQLIFYPHYEVQKYINSFVTTDSNVVIADFENYDVQDLLKDSMLLVTDFSSVFFDFSYMEKPIIYYQFDEDKFNEEHYKKGYFDYRSMGFGDVIINHEELITKILQYIESNFVFEEKYKNRVGNFFELKDTNNCSRIFKEIEEL